MEITKTNDECITFDINKIAEILSKALEKIKDYMHDLVERIADTLVSMMDSVCHWFMRTHSSRKKKHRCYFPHAIYAAIHYFPYEIPQITIFHKISFLIRDIYLLRTQDRGSTPSHIKILFSKNIQIIF